MENRRSRPWSHKVGSGSISRPEFADASPFLSNWPISAIRGEGTTGVFDDFLRNPRAEQGFPRSGYGSVRGAFRNEFVSEIKQLQHPFDRGQRAPRQALSLARPCTIRPEHVRDGDIEAVLAADNSVDSSADWRGIPANRQHPRATVALSLKTRRSRSAGSARVCPRGRFTFFNIRANVRRYRAHSSTYSRLVFDHKRPPRDDGVQASWPCDGAPRRIVCRSGSNPRRPPV